MVYSEYHLNIGFTFRRISELYFPCCDKKYRLLQPVIVVTASVEEDERGGQGHTSASLLDQSAT
jgi:hypothetical protein